MLIDRIPPTLLKRVLLFLSPARRQLLSSLIVLPPAPTVAQQPFATRIAPVAICRNWYWTVADWMYEFAQSLSTQPDAQLPKVLSMSYAWYELDQCDISPSVQPCTGVGVPAGSRIFVNAVNQMFAKVGSRGVTLLAASGDSGAHGRTDPTCSSPITRELPILAMLLLLAVQGLHDVSSSCYFVSFNCILRPCLRTMNRNLLNAILRACLCKA